MKKLFTAMLACMAAGPALAVSQWPTNPAAANLLISAEQETGATLPQVQETKDGKFWVTWLTWEDGMNGYIKAQLLDKEGNALLDKGGIYVMKRPTATWTSNYGMGVTSDGCLVVCHSDCGDDPDRQSFYPRAYKIDQEGNQLWGLDGVEFSTRDASGHRPKVGITNEGTIFIGFNDLSHSASEDSAFVIYKMNDDGTKAWVNPIETPGMFGAFSPCEEDDIYLSIINGGAITLQRIDSMGDFVWSDPVIVEDRDPNTRTEVQPISDETGGVVLAYQRYIDLATIYSGMQRISPDGELCMGLHGIDLLEEPGATQSAPGICLNGKRQEIIAAWNYDKTSNNYLYIQKYDYSGAPLWNEPVKYGGDYMWGYATTNGKILDDGTTIICYNDQHGAVESDIKLMKIDTEGNEIWTKQIAPVAYHDEPVLFFDQEKGEGYIFMTDNRRGESSSPNGAIYGQNFKLVDDSEVSVAEIANEAGIAISYGEGTLRINADEAGTAYIYDATGAQITSYAVTAGQNTYDIETATGLYIVRVVCGDARVTKKICL